MATNYFLRSSLLRYACTFVSCRNRCFSVFPSLYAQGSNKDLKVTHTGQVWSNDDKRMTRFEGGKEKQINEKFAIDLIAEVPPTASTQRIVSCDGGGGPLGHPKVYINLDQSGNHTCGYCGLRFYKEHHH